MESLIGNRLHRTGTNGQAYCLKSVGYARFGWDDLPGVSEEEFHFEPRLKLVDDPRNRRLGETEFTGSA